MNTQTPSKMNTQTCAGCRTVPEKVSGWDDEGRIYCRTCLQARIDRETAEHAKELAEEEAAEWLEEALEKAEEERESRKTGDCCLCEKQFTNWGHNPYPLCPEDDTDARCCDGCNDQVIYARLVRNYKTEYLKKRLADAKAVRRLHGRR
jgi:hypothetical protein